MYVYRIVSRELSKAWDGSKWCGSYGKIYKNKGRAEVVQMDLQYKNKFADSYVQELLLVPTKGNTKSITGVRLQEKPKEIVPNCRHCENSLQLQNNTKGEIRFFCEAIGGAAAYRVHNGKMCKVLYKKERTSTWPPPDGEAKSSGEVQS